MYSVALTTYSDDGPVDTEDVANANGMMLAGSTASFSIDLFDTDITSFIITIEDMNGNELVTSPKYSPDSEMYFSFAVGKVNGELAIVSSGGTY